MATGSEVGLIAEAYESLAGRRLKARVVSMPSWELFDANHGNTGKRCCPPRVTARVGVEQASTFGWDRYVGRREK